MAADLGPWGPAEPANLGRVTAASSSQDLHPRHGARFVLVRVEASKPVRYQVQIYLPDQVVETVLCLDEDGDAHVDPGLADPWAQAELLKLARVLKRDPRPEMTRWRGR